MTLLTACTDLAYDVGLAAPDVVVTSSDRTWVTALSIANATGEELVRRLDWPQTRATITVTGVGAEVSYDLPADFMRAAPGAAVFYGATIVQKTSGEEWRTLVAAEGAPRYYYLGVSAAAGVYPAGINLWPYLATGETVDVNYQSDKFCDGGAGFGSDTDNLFIDENLFVKGMIVRWRRQHGMDYVDQEAEYEAALSDAADSFGGV